jgi:hypothetical protein
MLRQGDFTEIEHQVLGLIQEELVHLQNPNKAPGA